MHSVRLAERGSGKPGAVIVDALAAILPSMHNASTLDWLTLGAIVWLIITTRKLRADLDKHEDACILFRKSMYSRVGKLETETARLDERTDK